MNAHAYVQLYAADTSLSSIVEVTAGMLRIRPYAVKFQLRRRTCDYSMGLV